MEKLGSAIQHPGSATLQVITRESSRWQVGFISKKTFLYNVTALNKTFISLFCLTIIHSAMSLCEKKLIRRKQGQLNLKLPNF
jgi:hypothetical protein